MTQPIRTAPKEEGENILASTTGKVWFQATWDAEHERWLTFNGYFENDARQPGAPRRFEPTMWVPLPKAWEEKPLPPYGVADPFPESNPGVAF